MEESVDLRFTEIGSMGQGELVKSVESANVKERDLRKGAGQKKENYMLK